MYTDLDFILDSINSSQSYCIFYLRYRYKSNQSYVLSIDEELVLCLVIVLQLFALNFKDHAL